MVQQYRQARDNIWYSGTDRPSDNIWYSGTDRPSDNIWYSGTYRPVTIYGTAVQTGP